jgi:hypothetical protein
MHTRHCLKLAARIDAHLLRELGLGIDSTRMLTDALYARDVLLVCDAWREGELPMLAHRYRFAAASPEPLPAAARTRSSFSMSSFFGSMFGAPSTLDSVPPQDQKIAAPARRWFGRVGTHTQANASVNAATAAASTAGAD